MTARFALLTCVVLVGAACQATPQAAVPASPAGPTAPVVPTGSVDELGFEQPSDLAEETIGLPSDQPGEDPPPPLGALPAAVAPPPDTCRSWVDASSAAPACPAQATDVLEALADALEQPDAAAGDRALAALETCSGLPPGLVRGLRAELAPLACADALVEPFLESPAAAKSPPSVTHALTGLAIAARLERAVASVPTLEPPHTRKRVEAFTTGPLKQWAERQATAVQALAERGADLRGYGRAVAAVASGLADMRLVAAVRGAPIPEDFKQDPEVETAYYAALDEALEPRKRRGRDAALVGLLEMAHQGVLVDARAEAARTLLSSLYGGRRIDALDHLLLPPASSPGAPADADARLARTLPAFYAGHLIPTSSLARAEIVEALAERGLAPTLRKHLSEADLPPQAALAVARARIGLAQLYWRQVDVDEALRAAATAGFDDPTAALLWATARALRGGPDNAAAMMVKAPLALTGIGEVEPLTTLARRDGSFAGFAAFNAALVSELALPHGASAADFRALADQYDAAAAALDGAERQEALERAEALRETAAAIQ